MVEVAQQFRVLDIFLKDEGSVSSTHVRHLKLLVISALRVQCLLPNLHEYLCTCVL